MAPKKSYEYILWTAKKPCSPVCKSFVFLLFKKQTRPVLGRPIDYEGYFMRRRRRKSKVCDNYLSGFGFFRSSRRFSFLELRLALLLHPSRFLALPLLPFLSFLSLSLLIAARLKPLATCFIFAGVCLLATTTDKNHPFLAIAYSCWHAALLFAVHLCYPWPSLLPPTPCGCPLCLIGSSTHLNKWWRHHLVACTLLCFARRLWLDIECF